MVLDGGSADQPILRAVQELRERGVTVSGAMERAIRDCPREGFVPEAGLGRLYNIDEAVVVQQDERGLPLSSATCLAFVVEMLGTADLRPGHRVLEIGTGPGFSAAVMGRLVGSQGAVRTVEVDPGMAERAARALAEHGPGNVSVTCADGFAEPSDSHPPYDRILVAVSAPEVSGRWIEGLVDGGRFVGVIDGPLFSVLLGGVRRGEGLRVDQCRSFGGWNTMRGPSSAGYQPWFPRKAGRTYPRPQLEWIERRPLPLPAASLVTTGAAGHGHPLDHPFWMVAALEGLGADWTCWVQGDLRALASLTDGQSMVRLDRGDVEVFGDDRLYWQLAAALRVWTQMKPGATVRWRGIVAPRGRAWPAPRVGQWLLHGSQTDLWIACDDGQATGGADRPAERPPSLPYPRGEGTRAAREASRGRRGRRPYG